ncbi:MAG: efflux RND transporter periplasmic adaptor subunit [Opitutaceae bacterium]|nr:efflux RND transporter periplasmic adaptor subunit [Cytophagales bacterium]
MNKNSSIFNRIFSILVVAFSFITTIFLTGCEFNSASKESEELKLPVVSLTTQPTQLHKYFVGDLNACQNVEIRARVEGYLEQIYVDEGKPVKKGQPLFRLSNKEFIANLSEAKANLRTAVANAMSSKLELDRITKLAEKGVISVTEKDVAEANYQAINAGIERAQSLLNNASTQLSYTYIKSPFDGVTDRNPFKVGSLISEGSLLTSVSDIEYIHVYFNVSERDYLEYMKNKQSEVNTQEKDVKLILADGSYYPFAGTIEKRDGTFDENTGTISFRAKFLNPNKTLKHGSTGTIELTTHMNNALLVPQKATFEIQDKNYVYVLNIHNEVEMRSFIPQRRYSDYYIVSSGLKPGDRVVYEGIQKLKNGMKIIPREIDLDSISSFSAFNQR